MSQTAGYKFSLDLFKFFEARTNSIFLKQIPLFQSKNPYDYDEAVIYFTEMLSEEHYNSRLSKAQCTDIINAITLVRAMDKKISKSFGE